MIKLKQMGYETKLDTNGSNPDVIRDCIKEKAVDYYAVDYKAPKDRYKEICRGESDPETVLETISVLLDENQKFEVRTTVIPQLSLDNLITMAEELPKVPKYILNPYKKPLRFLESDRELIETPPYSEKDIAVFAETLKLYQPNAVLVF